jgi:hypothetical protein
MIYYKIVSVVSVGLGKESQPGPWQFVFPYGLSF